jgi:hypothetical protein
MNDKIYIVDCGVERIRDGEIAWGGEGKTLASRLVALTTMLDVMVSSLAKGQAARQLSLPTLAL